FWHGSGSENLLVSAPLWYHPSRCPPVQLIIIAGEVSRESRLSYPRRIGWATGIFESGETVVERGRCGGTDCAGNLGGAKLRHRHSSWITCDSGRQTQHPYDFSEDRGCDRSERGKPVSSWNPPLTVQGGIRPDTNYFAAGRADQDAQNNRQDSRCVSQAQVRTSVHV